MSNTEKVLTVFLVVLALVVGFFCITPAGVALRNGYGYAVQKVDDATSYQTRKKVEDTCRAMIANYEADRISYEQYKDNPDPEKQGWAEQADEGKPHGSKLQRVLFEEQLCVVRCGSL